MKGCGRIMCPFCVHVAFDRVVGGYVVKVYQLSHLGRVVDVSSIAGRVKFEAKLSIEERKQLDNFGKMGYTSLQSKNGLSRLFSYRIYDSDKIYRVVEKAKNLQYGDATDCLLKLVEVGKLF